MTTSRVSQAGRAVIGSATPKARVSQFRRVVVASVASPRGLTEAVRDQTRKAQGARPVAFVKMEFDGGDTNLWSGIGDKVFGGDTYLGIGDLGSISTAEEGVELRDYAITFRLTGLKASFLATALGEHV